MEASRSSNAITFQVSNNLRSDNFGFVCLAPRRPTHHPSRLIDRTSWGTCPLQASSRKVRMVFLPRTYSGYLVQRPAGRPAVPVRDPVKWVRPRSRRAAWPIERCQLATAHCTRAHMRPAAADRIGSGFSLSDNLSWPESKADRRGRQIRCPIDPIDQHMLCASRWGKKLFYLLPIPACVGNREDSGWDQSMPLPPFFTVSINLPAVLKNEGSTERHKWFLQTLETYISNKKKS
jgi:hypothetical protein